MVDATTKATRQVMSRVNPQRIASICVTHQRETFVPVGPTGTLLRNGSSGSTNDRVASWIRWTASLAMTPYTL